MRSRYIYNKGEVVYAEERGVVTKNELEQVNDAGYMVMPDIQPYKSMIDGSMITSRSVHRSHLKQHGCVEVGNDSSLRAKPKPKAPPPGLKDEIIRAVNQVMSRRQ